MNTIQTYDSKTIFYHWTSAVLILGLWILGQSIDIFPKGPNRINARSVHIICGLILAILLVVRLGWRMQGGIKLPPSVPGLVGKSGVGVHYVLYLLVIFTILLGILAVWVRGDILFNVFQVSALDPTNKPLRKTVVEFHELCANTLLFLSLGHGLIAVWHHKIIKDEVLIRMWPGIRK